MRLRSDYKYNSSSLLFSCSLFWSSIYATQAIIPAATAIAHGAHELKARDWAINYPYRSRISMGSAGTHLGATFPSRTFAQPPAISTEQS